MNESLTFLPEKIFDIPLVMANCYHKSNDVYGVNTVFFYFSMIRHLLLNAKFKMIKAEETQGVELCDT